MNRNFRILLGLTTMLLLLVLALAVTPAQDESVLVIGFDQEPPNLYPMNVLGVAAQIDQFYTRDLWGWDTNNEPYAIMASALPSTGNGMVSINDDGNAEITVNLRAGLHWSDGAPITTADCAAWHEIVMNDATSDSIPRGGYQNTVVDFEVIDDLTYKVTLNGAYADFLVALEEEQALNCRYPAHVMNAILDGGQKLEESDYFTNSGDYAETVGFGPYKLVEWNIGSDMTFVPNAYWPADMEGFQAPIYDRVVIRFIPDPSQMLNALELGEIDLARIVVGLREGASMLEGVSTHSKTTANTETLWMRSGEIGNDDAHGGSALNDPLVRQAIHHALDRPTWAEQIVGAGTEVRLSWYPDNFLAADFPYLDYDLDGAAALLDEAGWVDSNGDGTRDKDGVELSNLRLFTTDDATRNAYKLLVQASLAEIGVGVDIFTEPAGQLYGSYTDGGTLNSFAWEMVIVVVGANPISPVTNDRFHGCSGIPSADNPSGFNPWQHCNPEYDAVNDELSVTFPGPERDALKAQVSRLFHDYYHGAVLFGKPDVYAIATDALDFDSVANHVGGLTTNQYSQIEYWSPAG